jgi:hypothetical protein
MSAPIRVRIRERDDPTLELWRIAESGETGLLEQLLARGAEVNAINAEGVTALMIAAYHGNVEMVRALTDYGADLHATDDDGFTALTLADHSGHEEIVRILLARGAKKVPRASAYASTDPFATDETYDTFSDAEEDSPPDSPSVRTLHEPPDIWDIVHETHEEFNPRSAFFAHVTSVHSIVLALVAVIAGGGAVWAFLKYRGASENPPAAPAVQVEKRNVETAQTAPATFSENAASSAEEPRPAPAAEGGSAGTAEPAPATVAAMPAPLAAPIEPRTATTALVKPDKREETKRRQQAAAKSSPAGTAKIPVTDQTTVKEDQQTGATSAAKSDNTAIKPDNEKRTEPTAAKKDEVKKEEGKKDADKVPSPQASGPPKTSPTPKPKVINWP